MESPDVEEAAESAHAKETSKAAEMTENELEVAFTSGKWANCGAPFLVSVAHIHVTTVATRLVFGFCGAPLGAPQKFGILWRILPHAP
jgi:hypothetical protein